MRARVCMCVWRARFYCQSDVIYYHYFEMVGTRRSARTAYCKCCACVCALCTYNRDGSLHAEWPLSNLRSFRSLINLYFALNLF